MRRRFFISLLFLSAALAFPACSHKTDSANSEQESILSETLTANGSQAEAPFRIALHSEPSSTSGRILADIPAGTCLDIISADEVWTRVLYNGISGYIYSPLLSDSAPADGSTSVGTIRMLSQEELDIIASSYDGTSKGYGAGPDSRNEQNVSQYALNLQTFLEEFSPVIFGNRDSQIIYLSFSLGWENAPNTATILDTLAEAGVKAVFYVNHEYASRNPDLIRRMIDEGHEIGNHGYSHPDAGIPSLSLSEQMQDAMAMEQYMQDEFGYTMKKYNFSSSEWSTQSVALMTKMGFQVCFYSFNYSDYDVSEQMEGSEVCQMLLDALSPGCIYYLHPVSTGNTAALPDFISQARERGYTFGTF